MPITMQKVDDLFVFWDIIGPEVVRLGLRNATDQQLEELMQLTQGLHDIGDLGTVDVESSYLLRIVEQGNTLFTALADASGNSYLASTYARLSGELLRVWTIIADSELVAAGTLLNMSDWTDLFKHRDADRLAGYSRDYIHALRDHVARTLVRWPSVMTTEVVPIHLR
jgi:DNA-binding GntR family transcriptional regulator